MVIARKKGDVEMTAHGAEIHAPLPMRRPARTTRSVFVVDDDIATLHLIGDLAIEAGWRTRGFTHLAAARRAVHDEPPDLLILDDELPDGRGGDLARELRAHSRLRGLMILVCTAASPARRAEIGRWARVLAKPFDLDRFGGFLEAAAGRARGDRASTDPAG
jgi:DNA-binding response OmpR family regulator